MENFNPEIFNATLRNMFNSDDEQASFAYALGIITGENSKVNNVNLINGLITGVDNYLSLYRPREGEPNYPYYLAFTKVADYLSSTPDILSELKNYNDRLYTQLPSLFIEKGIERLMNFYPDTADLIHSTITKEIDRVLITHSGLRIKNTFYKQDPRSVDDIAKMVISGDYLQERDINGYIELVRFARMKELYRDISINPEVKQNFTNKSIQKLYDNPKLAPTVYRKLSILRTSHLTANISNNSIDEGLPARLPAESHEWYMRHRMSEVFSNENSEKILNDSAQVFQRIMEKYRTKLIIMAEFLQENPDVSLLMIDGRGKFDHADFIRIFNSEYVKQSPNGPYSKLIERIHNTEYNTVDLWGKIDIVQKEIRKLKLFDNIYSKLKEKGIKIIDLEPYVSKSTIEKYNTTKDDDMLSELFTILNGQPERMRLNTRDVHNTFNIDGLLTQSTMIASIKRFGLSENNDSELNEAENAMIESLEINEIPQSLSEKIRDRIIERTLKFFSEQEFRDRMIEEGTFLSLLIIQHCAEVFINKATCISRTNNVFEIDINGTKLDFPISKSSPGKYMSQSSEYSNYIDFVSNVTFHDKKNQLIKKILDSLTNEDIASIVDEMGKPTTTTELNFAFIAYNANLSRRTINYFGYRKLFSEFETVYEKNPETAIAIINDLANLKKYSGKSRFELDKISLPYLYRLLTLYNKELQDLPEITQAESINQLFVQPLNGDLGVAVRSELEEKIVQAIKDSGLIELKLPSFFSDGTSGTINLKDFEDRFFAFMHSNNLAAGLNNYMDYIERYAAIRQGKELPYGSYQISGSDFIKIHRMNILGDSSFATNIIIDKNGEVGSLEEYMRYLLPTDSILDLQNMSIYWSDKSKSKFIVIQKDAEGKEDVSERLNLSDENISSVVIDFLEKKYDVQLLASAGMSIRETHLGSTGEGHHKCSGDQAVKKGVEDLCMMIQDTLDSFIETYRVGFGRPLYMTLDEFSNNNPIPVIRL